MSTPPAHALLLDLESTGTDPDQDYILEVGAILVAYTPELPVVGKANLVIRPPGTQQDHDTMWSRMDPFVQAMHTDNGLWRESTTGDDTWMIGEADDSLNRWLNGHGAGVVPIIGAGVGQLDIPFMKVYMPRLASRVTYWPIDFSNIRRGFELAGRGDVVDLATDVDAKPHRGLGDAEIHLLEARRFLRLLATVVDDRRPGDPLGLGAPAPATAVSDGGHGAQRDG